jgi:kynurenine formamidase
MPAVIDPVSGLELYELSHRWGMYTPIFPGYEEIKLERITHHAKQGVMTHKITTIFHTSTHLNAPIHLVPGAPAVGDLALQKFFGTGVVVSIPKRKWGLIEPSDLERTKPQIKAGDIVLINTGWHRKYSDSKEYFGYAPGLSKHAEAGIPTIENVGGDLDALGGKRCTFQGFPWKWHEGDACVIRLVALLDPKGTCRLERGAGRKAAAAKKSPAIKSARGAGSLQFFDLSHPWGHGMPQWPSRANLNVRVVEFHAKDGLLVQQFEGIMHRGTHMDAPIHVAENTPTLTGYPLWRFFGTGVAVSIPKGKWGVVTPKDLERAEPKIQKNDIVMINTGSHKNYGDNPDYFAYSPGLYKEAAEWLVERGVKLVGIDVQALDHPLGTFLGPHGPGPAQPHLDVEYKAETGRHIIEDFPYWEPAHKIMMTNGIPGIENIGGDIDAITGRRCTFFAFPWRWPEGEGCALRVVAVLDPKQAFRFETGR